ncbi:BSD domain-containing protein 1-B [Podospora fimiseda]|uniref:BSD domain-containing protein 1-B n=1 Tax=Podospora fimiseda TaxID=252190 RepID=A0AAN7H1R7_9PEZI|nr:BSD domain-containing protein 1-B [Podospora fimiseda]
MDLAYDHIQESNFPQEPSDSEANKDKKPVQQASLNAEFQDAYRAISSSPWASKIGGFFGSVVKQGESIYQEAQQELTAVSQDATRGFTDLRQSIINRTRSLSLNTSPPPAAELSSDAGDNAETTPTRARNTSEEALAESETVLSRLREEAAKRLKDLQRAEDAADEALVRFGSNLRDFLKDAIKIAPPSNDQADNQGNTVLFESKDAQGKRVIHTSRFDAQLHVIHTTTENFSKDGSGAEFENWAKEFDIDKKTDDIASDLAKYPELRATMEKLVPDQVPYADFWKRYYFLRHGIETAEARRRDLLKAASAEEEVGWDDEDSSEEESEEEESEEESDSDKETTYKRPGSSGSSNTIHPSTAAAAAPAAAAAAAAPQGNAKPSEPRKSDEKSVADSDISYDIVGSASGVPSRAPNSPKESRKIDESSDEEDWE